MKKIHTNKNNLKKSSKFLCFKKLFNIYGIRYFKTEERRKRLMKTKAIYSGILSIMLCMSFFSDARKTGSGYFKNKYQYRAALRNLRILPEASRKYRDLLKVVKEFQANYPELSRRWAPMENKTENDVLNYQGDSRTSFKDGLLFSLNVNPITGVSKKERTETIKVLLEMTSLSEIQIRQILESRNQEAVDQMRQLAIHVKENRKSVNPETINTLAELAYTMRNRTREAVSQQSNTPAVNVMLSLVRNIASMASTWAAEPRGNALKLIAAFNAKYKEFKADGRILTGRIAQNGLVASALNRALYIAEGIKTLRERNARRRELDVLCRK